MPSALGTLDFERGKEKKIAMENESLEIFYEEAMRVREERGRLKDWFKCKCPDYAENQFYSYKRQNKIPSVAIILQFEEDIEPAILYNVLKIKSVNNGNHERMIEEFFDRHSEEIMRDPTYKLRKQYKRIRLQQQLIDTL